MTQILVVKPGTLTRADKNKLRANGVVSVEAERPEDVRLLGTEGPALDGNDLFFAAMKAIASQREGYSSTVHVELSKAIHGLLFDARQKADAPDAA